MNLTTKEFAEAIADAYSRGYKDGVAATQKPWTPPVQPLGPNTPVGYPPYRIGSPYTATLPAPSWPPNGGIVTNNSYMSNEYTEQR